MPLPTPTASLQKTQTIAIMNNATTALAKLVAESSLFGLHIAKMSFASLEPDTGGKER